MAVRSERSKPDMYKLMFVFVFMSFIALLILFNCYYFASKVFIDIFDAIIEFPDEKEL